MSDSPEPGPEARPEPELEKKGMTAAAEGRLEEARDNLMKSVRPLEDWDVNREPPYSDEDAALQFGVLLQEGKGGPKNLLGAARCYVLAMKFDYNGAPLDAYLRLSEMYRSGEGVPKDPDFAKVIEDRLQARGASGWGRRPLDAIKLAEMYTQGTKFSRDLLKAANLYYVAEDKESSRKLHEQSAAEGNTKAHMSLAWSYLGGGWPVTEKDPRQAMDHFLAAAERGEAQGWYELGRMHQMGEVIPKDEAKAFDYFLKAPGPSAYYLGMAYWEGIVTKRDPEKARQFLLRVVKGEYYPSAALQALASMYRDGIGVPKDPVLAARFSPLVAAKPAIPPAEPKGLRPWEGDALKVVDINQLLSRKAPASSWLEYGKALMKATRISSASLAFTKASELGSTEAEWLLGRLYLGDWGMDGDEMSYAIEKLEQDQSKGKALVDSAVRKGMRPPVVGNNDDNAVFKEALAKANKYVGQDPRRLYYLFQVWNSMGGC